MRSELAQSQNSSARDILYLPRAPGIDRERHVMCMTLVMFLSSLARRPEEYAHNQRKTDAVMSAYVNIDCFDACHFRVNLFLPFPAQAHRLILIHPGSVHAFFLRPRRSSADLWHTDTTVSAFRLGRPTSAFRGREFSRSSSHKRRSSLLSG